MDRFLMPFQQRYFVFYFIVYVKFIQLVIVFTFIFIILVLLEQENLLVVFWVIICRVRIVTTHLLLVVELLEV